SFAAPRQRTGSTCDCRHSFTGASSALVVIKPPHAQPWRGHRLECCYLSVGMVCRAEHSGVEWTHEFREELAHDIAAVLSRREWARVQRGPLKRSPILCSCEQDILQSCIPREGHAELMNLWADALDNDKRIIHKWKHYFPIYERHFKDFVYKPVTFIEIGCGLGGSLQMWKRYFGPHARIIGIDVNPDCKKFEEDQVEVYIGQQQDLGFLERVIDQFGIPDIVVDDGSHIMSHLH